MAATLIYEVQNRTAEFQQCVQSVARMNRGSGVNGRPQAAGLHGNGATTAAKGNSAKSEFALRASNLAKDIKHTTEMLSRLAILAKKRTMFDDRPVEISELTFVIKQDIIRIKQSLTELQDFTRNKGKWSNKQDSQVSEHSKNVVNLLQGKLTDVTTEFQNVLEVRTKNIAANKSRTQQFLSASTSAADRSGSALLGDTSSPLYSSQNGSGPLGVSDISRSSSTAPTLSDNPYLLQDGDDTKDGASAYPGGDYLSLPSQTQQMALLEEQQLQGNQYLNERNQAVEAIESTIQELGGIFAQLATMVAEQGNIVQRIDANTEDISMNVTGAQRELLKYYARISSNRWLFVKIFGVLIMFFFLWVLVS